MSYWTHIRGLITVSPIGRTQAEKRYILDTVLDHLPKVSGSENDMHVHVAQRYGYSESSSHNEFDEPAGRYKWIRTQTEYFLVLEADLRDRQYEDTKQELNAWLNRLAKRMYVDDVQVRLEAESGKIWIISDSENYGKLYEWPTWTRVNDTGEPAWCEYLMWESAKDSRYPMKLAYKYYNDPENDAEYERRERYFKRGKND